MSNTSPPNTAQPRWVKLLINLGGIALVAHETVMNDDVRWPLLLVGVVMMGLASADLLDRYIGPRLPKEDR